ncbi:MAG: dihydrolipoamide acetyltransferase family protein [Phycisphaerae bacterium]
MAREFLLPDLGEGIHEAQIVSVKIREGDVVAEDQMIMEVETDKAAVEIPVPFAGTVSKLFVKAGDTVKVGQPLLAVDSAGSAPARAAAPAAARAEAPKAAPPPPRPAPMAPPPRPAPAPSLVGAGASPVTTTTRVMPAPAAAPVMRRDDDGGRPVPAAPAVRRQAREMGIDIGAVAGTGPGGRITRTDLDRHVADGGAPETAAPLRSAPSGAPGGTAASSDAGRAALLAEPLPDFAQWGAVRREPVSQIRKTIARQMVRSYTIVPHVTHCDSADVTDLEMFRKQHAEVFKEKGERLTLTAFILKAVAGALKQFPQLNCSFDEPAGEIIYKEYIHIGVAVDTPRGLVVPVIRDCDKKTPLRIARDLADLAERARAVKFDIAELRGGTFTVTNVGALGGSFVTPMINYPEVAILGLGRLAWQAAVRNMQVVPRQMLPLSLSFDHRVVDGADAARFVKTIISFLELPLNLLMAT